MPDKIVCLCVVKPGREVLALRAILGYINQTHVERVLLLAGSPQSLKLIYDAKPYWWTSTRKIVKEELQPSVPLIDTYRALLAKAKTLGSYLCFMDDDDMSHPDRLTRQYQSLYAGNPVFLSGGLLHFLATDEVYVIDYEKRFINLFERLLLGSFLVPFENLPDLADLSNKNVSWSLGRQILKRAGENVVRICHEPWWIKLGVHSDNRQTYEHFRELANHPERSMPVAHLYGSQCLLVRMLQDYTWDDATITVNGRDGWAYSFAPILTTNLPKPTFPEIQSVNEDV